MFSSFSPFSPSAEANRLVFHHRLNLTVSPVEHRRTGRVCESRADVACILRGSSYRARARKMPAPALGASATQIVSPSAASPAFAANGHRLSLVLGVMTAPGATRNRDNLRALSHRPHAHGVRTVFVLGDVECARRPTAAEHNAHRDFVFVNASDCQTWHRAAKVDAWYRHALARWPSAHWIGKSEDDALVRVSALARDLAALDATQPWYYGIMAWVGLCDSEAPACDSAPTGCCLGACFAGPLQRVHTNSSACMSGRCSPPGCRPKPPAAARRRSCPPQSCAEALIVPFAIGPVEVRSAPLARAVAECSTSGRYFASLSVAGETLREDISSMDGNQGLPLARCVPCYLSVVSRVCLGYVSGISRQVCAAPAAGGRDVEADELPELGHAQRAPHGQRHAAGVEPSAQARPPAAGEAGVVRVRPVALPAGAAPHLHL